LCAVVTVAVERWVAREVGLRRALLGVVIVVAFGFAVAFATAPRPGAYLFGVLLGWSWTLGLVLPPVLAATAVQLLRKRTRSGWLFAAAGAVVVVATVDAFVIEPRSLEVNVHVVRSDRVAEPLRIAVIADLQTDAPGEHEAAALRAVMAARPDVILFAGDMIQTNDRDSYRAAWAALREIVADVGLDAPLGVYAVQGDVERRDLWEAELGGTGIVVPAAGAVRLRADVDLTGLDLRRSARGRSLPRPHADRLHVVVGHRPDYALGRIDADLLVAGHTHGGQVRLPFIGPLVTLSNVPRSWAAGRTDLDADTTLVVSRGVGMERGVAPRVRFLCRPEVVIVDVVPAR
jgi:hypothetical protein